MISKRYKALPQETKKLKYDTIENLLKAVKKNCTTKFDESIDVNFQLNLKQKKSEVNIRTVLNLPIGKNKKIKVAVICEEEKLEEAKKSGADVIGSADFINNISAGKINFDKLISTPKMMIKLSKLGKILGPKGLMPNPKSGTVTNDIKKAVIELKAGKVELRVDKTGIIHVPCGKVSFGADALVENIKTIYLTIMKARPASVKGQYLKKMTISSTMGPGVKIDYSTIR